ncbi:MAG: hypothetical protein ACR2QC_09830 [Gammaproteobacteria bacterium]
MSAKTKSAAIPAKAGISFFTLIFRFNHPFHSCFRRNGMGREWDGENSVPAFLRAFLLRRRV